MDLTLELESFVARITQRNVEEENVSISSAATLDTMPPKWWTVGHLQETLQRRLPNYPRVWNMYQKRQIMAALHNLRRPDHTGSDHTLAILAAVNIAHYTHHIFQTETKTVTFTFSRNVRLSNLVARRCILAISKTVHISGIPNAFNIVRQPSHSFQTTSHLNPGQSL